MKGKIVDSNQDIHTGGRADEYWTLRSMKKRKRSGTANTNEYNSSNVDIEKIKSKYNIRGFEFGNWLNEEDRVDYMIAVDTALSTLSKIMHSKNVGMSGLIGIAFGARGRGNAVAHYEPQLNMINLTKTKGDHSLAHEYGHAIDYNFGRYVDQSPASAALSGGSSTAKVSKDTVGGAIRKTVNKIVDIIMASESFDRLSNHGDYWHRRTEVFARWFEQFCANECYCTFLSKPVHIYEVNIVYLTKKDYAKTVTLGRTLCKQLGKYLNGK